jgi:hypothetical protein
MLYWLLPPLANVAPFLGGLNVARYITFRTAAASLTALFLSLVVGPWFIRKVRDFQLGQIIRQEGPQSHRAKAGTPTMGGILILGSAIVSVTVRDGGRDKGFIFTGDLGHRGLPIVRDPALVEKADVLVMESTYGNRVHKGMAETVEEFLHALKDTLLRKGGNVIIPAFAVGRAQDILFLLTDLTRKGRVKGLTLYIDSPLAAQATQITLRHPECFDEEARQVLGWGKSHPDALRVVVTASTEESMALNSVRGGAIILAGSGMCEAGRIKHHLKHNLWRKESSIVIVGFQAEGTLGRRIVDGAQWVRCWARHRGGRRRLRSEGCVYADRDDLLSGREIPVAAGQGPVAHGRVGFGGVRGGLRNRFGVRGRNPAIRWRSDQWRFPRNPGRIRSSTIMENGRKENRDESSQEDEDRLGSRSDSQGISYSYAFPDGARRGPRHRILQEGLWRRVAGPIYRPRWQDRHARGTPDRRLLHFPGR